MANTFVALDLQCKDATDAQLLNQHQHAKYDPATGLVWIEDGTAGVAHSAHPNVEANRITRKLREYAGWIEVRGFLYSPEVFASTDLDKLAAKYCQCSPCIASRRKRA